MSAAEADEVRLEWDAYDANVARTARVLDAARDEADILLYALPRPSRMDASPEARRAATLEATSRHETRRATLLERLEQIEADLATKALTAAQRDALDAESRALALFAFVSGESLDHVLTRPGTIVRSTLVLPNGQPVALTVTADGVRGTRGGLYDEVEVPFAALVEAVIA